MSTSSPASPTTPPITDLTHVEHIQFIQSFQSQFDAFRTTPDAVKHGAQIKWVIKNVMGAFQANFGSVTPDLLLKVDRYLRNHTTYRNPKALPRSVPIPDLGTRGVSWLQVLAEDRKEEIGERSAVLRDTEGGMGGDSSVHLNHFRRSRNEIASSLPEAEVQRYKQLAQVISEARKTPPTAAAVFERQPILGPLLTSVIRSRLGWEAGQFGDAVCFLAVAYRAEDQEIHSHFSFVSNQSIPQDDVLIPNMVKNFNEHLNPTLQRIANKFIPRIETEHPQLEMDIDDVTPKELRGLLLQHIVASWVASDSQFNTRTAENIPWKDLKSVEGQERYLVNYADFARLGFFNPTSASSHDALREFAMALMRPSALPLFKSTSTMAFSPDNTPSPSLPSSPNQDTTNLLNNLSQNPGPEQAPSPTPAMMSLPRDPPPITASSRPVFTSNPPLAAPTPPTPMLSIDPQLTGSTAAELPEGSRLDVRSVTEQEDTTSTAIRDIPESSKQEHNSNSNDGATSGDNASINPARKRKRGAAARPPPSTRNLRSGAAKSQTPAVTTKEMNTRNQGKRLRTK